MHKLAISVQPLGDRAFSLLWREPISTAALAAKSKAIGGLAMPWFQEAVPAFRTVTIHMNHSAYSLSQASEELLQALDLITEEQLPQPRHVEIPVVYGGKHGPDLAESARRSGITERQFVERHSEAAYVVAMIGFAPGFPYLSGLHETLAQPRHESPRLKVPAGAVGIAGNQTGIYPITSPGGWQIIGTAEIPLFRPEEQEPFLLAQGDTVKFIPVERHAEETTGLQEKEAVKDTSEAQGTRSLTVLKPGLLTTIQDLGRRGWQAFGVSVGGAMDEVSMRTANLLIGNDEDAAVLEMTLIGGSYVVERDLLISLCGADLEASVNGERIPMNRPVWLSRGVTLMFGRTISGCRTYLAVAGGIDVPHLLGSRSTDPRARMGGGFGRALMSGDALSTSQPTKQTKVLQASLRRKAKENDSDWSSVNWSTTGWNEGLPNVTKQLREPRVIKLRLLLGAEWNEFTSESQERLFRELYRVEASSDRMGLRLSGTALKGKSRKELESHGVAAGTIQVPSNGQPIILAAGCQPTGGYPKIGHVISADLPLLAQAIPGDWLGFEPTDIGTAEHALMERERDLAILKAGILAHARV